VLVENSVQTGGLRAEHGLSLLLELGPHRVLFDTGQTDLFLENAKVLRCPMDGLDAMVLSHGHYDHTGGLAAACRQSPGARVWLHPDALQSKFTVNADGTPRDIGMPGPSRRALDEPAGRVTFTTDHREVVPGIFVTGAIPRRTSYEDVGGRFFVDPELQKPDGLDDDQAIYVPTRQGTVVVLGCAHAGVINTLRHIQCLTGESRIRAVLGGMHLVNASDARLEATLRDLGEGDIPLLVPAHCTGAAATARLWATFAGRCAGLGVGSRFTFDR
jgi:7,8-dihydropterin-6-yl-methyl-4-(beta-D-ribofuranosyl)aminobenzene 5'-phosphate synthase